MQLCKNAIMLFLFEFGLSLSLTIDEWEGNVTR